MTAYRGFLLGGWVIAAAAFQAAAAAPPGREGHVALELRGLSTAEGIRSFYIYDAARMKGTWVGLNESSADYVAKAFDPTSGMLTVEAGGRMIRIALEGGKIQEAKLDTESARAERMAEENRRAMRQRTPPNPASH
jgi:hypothetical protein